MRRLQRSISWVRRSLQLLPATDEALLLPGSIAMMLDAFGTENLSGVSAVSANGNAGVAAVSFAAVPANFVDLVVAAELSCNDPVARALCISMTDPTGIAVGMIEQVSKAVGLRVALNRRAYVPTGCALSGFSDAIAAGQVLTLRAITVRLPAGEYSAAV